MTMAHGGNLRTRFEFEEEVEKYDRELGELVAQLNAAIIAGEDRIRQRLKNPNGKTTPLATRETALKRVILEKLGALTDIAADFSKLIFQLHLAEVELGLVLDGRRQASIEYWKRLVDGKVYAGARQFLDILNTHHGIDAAALATLNESEIFEINHTIEGLFSRRKGRAGPA